MKVTYGSTNIEVKRWVGPNGRSHVVSTGGVYLGRLQRPAWDPKDWIFYDANDKVIDVKYTYGYSLADAVRLLYNETIG